MPHVVIITNYPFPGVGATANRVKSLAEGMARCDGWRVTVVGPGPDSASKNTDGRDFLFDVRTALTNDFSRTNLLKRAVGELKQVKALFQSALTSKPDVLVVTIPSIFLLLISLYRGSTPVIVDFRDLVWEYFANRRGVHAALGRVLRMTTHLCLKRVSAITVTNEQELTSISSLRNVPQVSVVHNGLERRRLERLKPCFDEMPAYPPLTVLYVGNIGLAQGLDTLIDAVADLDDIEVILIGEGADLPRLQSKLEQARQANVTIVGALPWEQVVDYYRKAHVLYAQIGKEFASAIPSKLYEYLGAGRPVICGAPRGSARGMLGQFEGIYLVEPGQIQQLRQVLHELGSVKLSARQFKANLKQLQEHYVREDEAAKFAKITQQVFDASAG